MWKGVLQEEPQSPWLLVGGSEEQQPLEKGPSGHSLDSLIGQAHLGICPFVIEFLGWMIMDVLT